MTSAAGAGTELTVKKLCNIGSVQASPTCTSYLSLVLHLCTSPLGYRMTCLHLAIKRALTSSARCQVLKPPSGPCTSDPRSWLGRRAPLFAGIARTAAGHCLHDRAERRAQRCRSTNGDRPEPPTALEVRMHLAAHGCQEAMAPTSSPDRCASCSRWRQTRSLTGC